MDIFGVLIISLSLLVAFSIQDEVMDVAWSVPVLFQRYFLLTMNNEESPGIMVFWTRPISTQFPVNGIRVGDRTLRSGEGFPKSFAWPSVSH